METRYYYVPVACTGGRTGENLIVGIPPEKISPDFTDEQIEATATLKIVPDIVRRFNHSQGLALSECQIGKIGRANLPPHGPPTTTLDGYQIWGLKVTERRPACRENV